MSGPSGARRRILDGRGAGGGSRGGHAGGKAGGPARVSGGGRYHVAFLYEDDDIVAVDKPCGLLTIAPEGARSKSLYDIVTDHIRKRNPKGRAAVVHRLDRETSGVIVFAKNAHAKTELMGAWNESVDERLYIALVEGNLPEPEGVFDTWLSEDDPFRVRQVERAGRGALRAITKYKVIGVGNGYNLVELSLETGRRHQIRVQLSAAGCPIAGDERYGSRRDPLNRLCLHAALIVIKTPAGGEPIRVESPPPPEFRAALRGSASREPGGSRNDQGSERGAPSSARGSPHRGSPERGPRSPSGRPGSRPFDGRPGDLSTDGRPDSRVRQSIEDRDDGIAPPRAPRPRSPDPSRAWPGGGPLSRGEKPRERVKPSSAPGERGAEGKDGAKKSSSRYSTPTKRKP